jgi:hypothetical protein
MNQEPILRAALEQLAAEPVEQVGYLREFGTWPSLDELALGLDDVAEASESWASPGVCDRVRVLSTRLGEMSGETNSRLWDPEALWSSEWAAVRALAVEALAALDRHG